MKKFCTILLFFCGSVSAFSQANIYLQNNPIWTVNLACAEGGPDCIRYASRNYLVGGDTTIGLFVYKKIFVGEVGYYSNSTGWPSACTTSFSYLEPDPRYFLRSSAKQMFVVQFNDTIEYLLYDFNLSVGDSLPLSWNNFSDNVVVTAIDSIYTPYGYRKRFAISNAWPTHLIEGVGHTIGLFEPMQLPLECGYNLTCFSLNDTAYYPGAGPSCNVMAGFSNNTDEIPTFDVFPNPASDQIVISSSLSPNNASLRLLNLMGELVMEEKIISGNSFSLDLSKLAEGVYFVEINNAGVISRKKIVKK